MLVAHNKDGERVLGRNASRQLPYFCPECNGLLVLKQGREVIWHFAHKTRCDCAVEGETLEHLAMKQWVYDHFSLLDDVSICELEWPLRDIGRRADVYLEGDWGRVAVECQVSNLDYKE